jgi:hypothetical protein
MRYQMKALVIAAVTAAAIGLAACSGHSTTPKAAPTSHGNGTSTAIAPVSCSQQYRSWNHGEGEGVMDALTAVTSAATARNGQALTTALHQARPAVTKGARHPIPACADPRGYWPVLLMHVNAAVSSKASASNVRAAMQDVPNIHNKLVEEVKQITH